MAWTVEQKKAIDLRGANLLVSAAAGSGKTAVLVERIIKMVCEEDYDIDKILVVTFTKAAAAEMKERIGKRLLEESIHHPDNPKIGQQLSYIHRAPISTIHSFCTNLLRNYFHMISLDPGFRIGEEGEVALLKQKVLDDLLEECYKEKTQEFLDFVEAYSYGKDDRKVGEMILRLFDFSISHPMPDQWLTEALEALHIEEKEPAWLAKVMEYGDRILSDCVIYLENAIRMCHGVDVLEEKYVPFLNLEKADIENLKEITSYDERVEAFSEFKFKRIPAIRTKDAFIKEKQEAAKAIRDEVKTMVQSLGKDSFSASLSVIRKEADLLLPYLETLIDLVRRFSDAFLRCKLDKNMLEFHDLEHFSLKLLVEDFRDGVVKKTALAEELSRQYQAVFTDEYQDSNLIQEVLLKAVSREEDGNRFMVGDIKQSIYRFRMVRPEIFLEKYALGGEEGLHQTVELKNNFRSRPEVLYSINSIFYQIMKPSLGDVLYEKKVALTPPPTMSASMGGVVTELLENADSGTVVFKMDNSDNEAVLQEILILDQEKESENSVDLGDISMVEVEAKMIAGKIKELEGYEYKDIVILLRTMEGWAGVFEDVLTMEGIPVHAESKTGYFDTFEIRVLLNILSVVDNIYQDIPLAAVLRSSVGGFSGEDMAHIRSLVVTDRRQQDSLYDEMLFYLERGDRADLKEKIDSLIALLDQLREEKTRLSLPELIWSVIEKTDYYHLVGSMPNGQQRMANIRMFLEKAAEYEKTSFKGVFHFLQYMEQIRTYEVDYGEATILGEEANVVRIMSIHKSKGLEFPVVFLSGLGKMFNFMDRNQRMLLHPDYYIGLDLISLETRTKRPSVQKKMISRQLVLSMLGEELRVLYVAMTRARDKLIMTGSVDDFAKWMRNYGERPSTALSFTGLSKATCYLHWIFPAILRSHAMDAYRESYGISMAESEYFEESGETPNFRLFVGRARDALASEVEKEYKKQYSQAEFLSWLSDSASEYDGKDLEKAFSWQYPKKNELKVKSKWSVSQLKHEAMEELFVPVENETANFLKEKKEEVLTGAARGTAVHKLMEVMSFAETAEIGLEAEIEKLTASGRLPVEYVDILPTKRIEWFLNSNLCKRLAEAEKSGNLYREAQFMMGVPMKEMEPETDSDELVLVQGIIDLYMEEEDGLVLLDYKTDRVDREHGEEVLISRYKAQLLWYKKALEQMTEKKVKENLIYSFTLGKTIYIVE